MDIFHEIETCVRVWKVSRTLRLFSTKDASPIINFDVPHIVCLFANIPASVKVYLSVPLHSFSKRRMTRHGNMQKQVEISKPNRPVTSPLTPETLAPDDESDPNVTRLLGLLQEQLQSKREERQRVAEHALEMEREKTRREMCSCVAFTAVVGMIAFVILIIRLVAARDERR
jgi:hypothetical protein